LKLIKEFYNKTYVERLGQVDEVQLTAIWALTTTIFFLPGGMIGAFCAGYVADRFGRWVMWHQREKRLREFNNYLCQRIQIVTVMLTVPKTDRYVIIE